MIGSLMYLTSSRPCIRFSTCLCTRYQANPKESHLVVVKRIFWYLKGTPCLGLWYLKGSSFDLKAYSYSDYERCNLAEYVIVAGWCAQGSHFKGDIELHFVPTDCQLADIFTKPLAKPSFTRLVAEWESVKEALATQSLSDEKNSNLTSIDLINKSPVKIKKFSPIWNSLTQPKAKPDKKKKKKQNMAPSQPKSSTLLRQTRSKQTFVKTHIDDVLVTITDSTQSNANGHLETSLGENGEDQGHPQPNRETVFALNFSKSSIYLESAPRNDAHGFLTPTAGHFSSRYVMADNIIDEVVELTSTLNVEVSNDQDSTAPIYDPQPIHIPRMTDVQELELAQLKSLKPINV
ncbi:hypothetical protein Tco_1119503 [Tanacetum coccineum]